MSSKLKQSKDFNCQNNEDVAAMIDSMMNSGTSRLKVIVSDNLNDGEVKKEYHHGRCDINSPFACGSVFDLLESEE